MDVQHVALGEVLQSRGNDGGAAAAGHRDIEPAQSAPDFGRNRQVRVGNNGGGEVEHATICHGRAKAAHDAEAADIELGGVAIIRVHNQLFYCIRRRDR